jgi:succinyl-diaminopimelate desuccinylase
MDGKAIYPYKQQILADLQELLRIPSVQGSPAPGAPYGIDTVRALDFVLRRGAELGFKTRNVDGHAGHVEYGDRGPLIGILVHLDVVPPGEGWEHEPFGGTLEEGCVYGRGASDDKGPAVAALYSLRAFADAVPDPQMRIRVIFGLNEESGMAGVRHYFEHEPVPDYGFSPDAVYPLLNRESGIAHVFLRGRRSPGSADEKVAHTAAGAEARSTSAASLPVRTIDGGLAFNMVPAAAEARVDPAYADTLRRFLDEEYLPGTAEPRIPVARDEDPREGVRVTAEGVSAHGGMPSNGVNALDHLLLFIARAFGEAGPQAPAGVRDPDAARGAGAAGRPVVPQDPDAARGPRPTLDPVLRWIVDNLVFDTQGNRMGIACRDHESGRLSVNLGLLHVTTEHVEVGLDIRYPVTWEWETLRSVLERRAGEAGLTVVEKQHLPPLYVPEDAPLVTALLRAYRRVTGDEAEPQAMPGGTYARMLENRGVAFGANFPGEDTRGHRPDEFIKLDSLMTHAEIQTEALFELARLGAPGAA